MSCRKRHRCCRVHASHSWIIALHVIAVVGIDSCLSLDVVPLVASSQECHRRRWLLTCRKVAEYLTFHVVRPLRHIHHRFPIDLRFFDSSAYQDHAHRCPQCIVMHVVPVFLGLQFESSVVICSVSARYECDASHQCASHASAACSSMIIISCLKRFATGGHRCRGIFVGGPAERHVVGLFSGLPA